MSLTSITKDFFVRAGLTVLGSSTVSSSTGNTSTLQVNGGAAIAKNLVVGSTSNLHGLATLYDGLSVTGNTTATGIVKVTNITESNSTASGALQVVGGAGIAGSLFVGNTASILSPASSTSTLEANALYVEGGVGVKGDLYVQGAAVFQNDVVFSGTTTYVYSTQTVYTDNILNLHVPNGGVSGTWVVNDGKDIGLIFHNYVDGSDNDSFLGWANDSGYLEWYGKGLETGLGTFTNGVYGIFKTGGIRLVNTQSANSTVTGALQVVGGAGFGGDVFVGGTIKAVTGIDATVTTATNLAGGAQGSIAYQTEAGKTAFIPIGSAGLILLSNGTTATWAPPSGLSAGSAATATNLQFGAQYEIPYQTGAGATAFESAFTYNYDTNTLNVNNALLSGILTATTLNVTGRATFNETIATVSTVTTFNVTGRSTLGEVSAGVTTATNLNVTTGATFNAATATTFNVTGRSTLGEVSAGVTTATNLNVTTGATFNVTTITTANVTGQTVLNTVSAGQTTATNLNVTTGATFNVATATTLTVTGRSTLGEVVATATTVTSLSASGIVNITNNTNAVATNDGALRVTGGVGVAQDIFAGGLITAGATLAATTGTTVPAFFFNNTLLSSFTSNSIATTSTQNLDAFASATYRSARYFNQITAGSSIHISEISVFHDGTKAYINEYGISTNNGQLGTFDATLGGGNVTLTFTANTTTAMTVKMTRIALTV